MKKTLTIVIIFLLLAFSSYLIFQTSQTLKTQKNTPSIPSTKSTPTPSPINSNKPTLRDPQKPTPPKATPLDGNTYGCDPQGVCNAYQNVRTAQCPKVFTESNCNNECQNLEVRCKL